MLGASASGGGRDAVSPADRTETASLRPMEGVGPAEWRAGRWNVNAWGPVPGQALAFAADHVTHEGSDVVLALDSRAAAQLQTTDAYGEGAAAAKLTLPPLASGQDAAFFLYSKSGDELDFEFLSRGLWLCVHQGGKQYGRFLDHRNHGSETIQLAVSWSSDLTRFSMNGSDVWSISPKDLPSGMTLPKTVMQVFFSNSAFADNAFFGRFDGVPLGEVRRMVVHDVSLPRSNSANLAPKAQADQSRG